MVNKGFPLIEISGSPCSNDVLGDHDLYTQLPMDNVTITSISDVNGGGGGTGTDGTGPASSYADGSIVRGEKVIPGSTTCDTPDDTVFIATGDGMTSNRVDNADGSYTITNYWRGMASSGTTYYPDGSQQNFQY